MLQSLLFKCALKGFLHFAVWLNSLGCPPPCPQSAAGTGGISDFRAKDWEFSSSTQWRTPQLKFNPTGPCCVCVSSGWVTTALVEHESSGESLASVSRKRRGLVMCSHCFVFRCFLMGEIENQRCPTKTTQPITGTLWKCDMDQSNTPGFSQNRAWVCRHWAFGKHQEPDRLALWLLLVGSDLLLTTRLLTINTPWCSCVWHPYN